MDFKKLLSYALASTLTGCSSIYYIEPDSALFKENDIIRVVQYDNKYCKINIPFRRYLYYKSLPHQDDFADNMHHYITLDEPKLEDILKNCLDLPTKEKEHDAQRTLDFVHSFVYIPDKNQYTKMPLETIVEGGGDCEDLTVLTYSLLKKAGHDVIYIRIPPYEGNNVGHVLVGVAGNFEGASVIHQGKTYFLAETTGTIWPHQPVSWRIGQLPDESWVKRTDIRVYEIK